MKRKLAAGVAFALLPTLAILAPFYCQRQIPPSLDKTGLYYYEVRGSNGGTFRLCNWNIQYQVGDTVDAMEGRNVKPVVITRILKECESR